MSYISSLLNKITIILDLDILGVGGGAVLCPGGRFLRKGGQGESLNYE
jgi:hypothetical protein